MLEFPSSPVLNQKVGNYYWDGTKWVLSGQSGSALLEITNWTPVTQFWNGWVNYGGVYPVAEYRKVGDMVQLRGFIKNGTLNTSAFTLPAGFRPHALLHWPVATGSTTTPGVCYIEPDGDIAPVYGSTSWVSLEGIAFSTTVSGGAKIIGGGSGQSFYSGPPVFQTIAERDAFFPTPPPNGTRCFVRLCEWMYVTGTGWRAIPFVQGTTTVQAAVGGIFTWVYPIPYQSWQSGVVCPSNTGYTNPPSTATPNDPAGYNAAIQLKWTAQNVPATWRYEVQVSGYLDGFT